MTGKKPVELLRKRDKTYKEMKLDQNKKTDSEIIIKKSKNLKNIKLKLKKSMKR